MLKQIRVQVSEPTTQAQTESREESMIPPQPVAIDAAAALESYGTAEAMDSGVPAAVGGSATPKPQEVAKALRSWMTEQ